MILLKSCPRCGGDIMPEEMLGEVEMVCLQCGHRADAETPVQRSGASVRIAKKAA